MDIQPVTNPVNRADNLFSGKMPRYLLPQILYVRIDCPVVPIEIVSLNDIYQLVSRKDPVRMAQKRSEKIVLTAGELELMPAGKRLMCPLEQTDLSADEHFVGLLRGMDPSEHGLHTRNDLPRAERFADIIIRSELQTEQPVDLFHSSGKHDYRDIRELSDLAAYLHAVRTGEHDVEQDQAGGILLD